MHFDIVKSVNLSSHHTNDTHEIIPDGWWPSQELSGVHRLYHGWRTVSTHAKFGAKLDIVDWHRRLQVLSLLTPRAP
jgi:hypothetical protein